MGCQGGAPGPGARSRVERGRERGGRSRAPGEPERPTGAPSGPGLAFGSRRRDPGLGPLTRTLAVRGAHAGIKFPLERWLAWQVGPQHPGHPPPPKKSLFAPFALDFTSLAF